MYDTILLRYYTYDIIWYDMIAYAMISYVHTMKSYNTVVWWHTFDVIVCTMISLCKLCPWYDQNSWGHGSKCFFSIHFHWWTNLKMRGKYWTNEWGICSVQIWGGKIYAQVGGIQAGNQQKKRTTLIGFPHVWCKAPVPTAPRIHSLPCHLQLLYSQRTSDANFA